MRKFLLFIAALAIICLGFPVLTHAQSGAQAILTATNLGSFPQISAYLRVHRADGTFLDGLQASNVTVLEDEVELPATMLASQRAGAQLVVAVNYATPFAIRDNQGVARYERIAEALQAWAESLPADSVDDLSLVTLEGTPASHVSAPTDWLTAFQAYAPEPSPTGARLELLSRAIDQALDSSPRPGMGRAVLYLTPSISPDSATAVQDLATRAAQAGVRVFVWVVDTDAFFDTTRDTALRDLADQTGGSYFAFSGGEPFPDLESYFEPLRWVYQLLYRSEIDSPGTHQVAVSITTEDLELVTPTHTFDLQVQPPNPILISPPTQILRTYPEQTETDEETLAPSGQGIDIIVEFPDGFDRRIEHTALYVNGVVVAENTAAPFDHFDWDLTPYTEGQQLLLRVEAVDELGLSGFSVDTPVTITVQRLPQGFRATLSRYAPFLAVGLALLAAAALLLVLIMSGRLRPRPITTPRRPAPSTYEDPLTQPVRTSAPASAGRPSPTVLRSPRGGGRVASAYLIPLSDSGQYDPRGAYPLRGDSITFGRDPDLADLAFDHPALEPVHARLWLDEQGVFHLADQGTVAGTWINYAPVSAEGAQVEPGDLIHIGRLAFRFSVEVPTVPRKTALEPQDDDE